MVQYYKIAGLTVEMDTFGRTETQAQAYLCEPGGPVDMVVRHNGNEALHQQEPHMPLSECEHVNTAKCFYSQLLRHQGMMLHASAVVVDGRAYLFSATSGTGKSTHVKLWLDRFGDRAVLLNDDKPALRLEDGVWYAYGTPWSGKHNLNVNMRVPLAGIAVLERAKDNSITPMTGTQAIFRILEQTLRPADAQAQSTLLELLNALLTRVPVWKLSCNMDPEAAVVAYEAMSGMKKEK